MTRRAAHGASKSLRSSQNRRSRDPDRRQQNITSGSRHRAAYPQAGPGSAEFRVRPVCARTIKSSLVPALPRPEQPLTA
ncbi:hypothetical protein MPTK1_4g08720 [Marchantia polymorpha subsp. ruderalis]|uniref:Uncharacterized protein n=2 Tax=Marchantia polymorpha TaxID=3197 RepID=A0AAF6B7U7_MARPO|nr:hypothetical protein MARPO_0157s0007 [Marchantia polymorpha]BBN08081.1 hypothetical protein Mp_4g08720 [Marchantia polymorpha subsp. ruderalis]|eukprot:PTQ28675.1 hypothetical protein MARPO_0157s0007 [Marchantia polymorpha]